MGLCGCGSSVVFFLRAGLGVRERSESGLSPPETSRLIPAGPGKEPQAAAKRKQAGKKETDTEEERGHIP